jgi:hypothetical protein
MELVLNFSHLIILRMDQMMEFIDFARFARNLVAIVVKYQVTRKLVVEFIEEFMEVVNEVVTMIQLLHHLMLYHKVHKFNLKIYFR